MHHVIIFHQSNICIRRPFCLLQHLWVWWRVYCHESGTISHSFKINQ